MAESPNRLDAYTHRRNRYIGMDNRYGYLQFMYHNPVTGSNVPFPSGTPVNIIYFDNGGAETPHSGNPLSLDADGKITFFIEHRTNLYFEFNFSQKAYINITSNSLIYENDVDNVNAITNMIFMLPQQFNLKNSTWTIDSVPVYDSTTRTFRDLEANPLSGASGHLPVTLTPEWQYVGFQFYDKHAKTQRMVPQYIILNGYNEDVDEDNPATRSNVFKDNSICLPWIEDRNLRNTRSPEDIVLKFATINSYVDSGAGVARHTRDEVRAMPLRDRFRHYDLPEYWSSKNWDAKLGANSSNLQPFQDASVVNGNSTSAIPIVFELDTVVITDDELEYDDDWDEENHFTFFNINMSINNPQTNRPYWTRGTVDRNFFPMDVLGDHPRVLAVNGRFYDITDKRSIDGDVIGARAAVLNDESVHHGDEVEQPYHSAAGNIELHYFIDCLDEDENVIPALLIYWSCTFESGEGVPASAISNFRRHGMTNSKERWEHKGYRFRPRSDSSGRDTEVRPVFFFEARESDPYKCTVTILPAGSGRSNMGLTEAEFKSNEYESQASGVDDIDVDGGVYGRFTMAHELGHATGLMDEYTESLEEDNRTNLVGHIHELWNPPLPQFDQPFFPGRPYPWDNMSMMDSNKATRLRHFWHYCRWLNNTDEIKSLTGNTVFHVHYADENFSYFLPESMTNFYEPVIEEEDVDNGSHGEFNLELYKIGNDETTEVAITDQSDFDGILVVRSKLQWFFEDNEPNTWASIRAKLRFLRDFHTAVDSEVNNKYYLECPSDSDFKKVYVFFSPHYYFEGSTIYDHFEITVNANNGATIITQPEFFEDGFDDDEFEIDALQDPISIYRYVLGLRPYNGSGNNKTANDSILQNELTFLETWIGSKRGRTYELKVG